MEATDYADRLAANVDNFYADRWTYAEFDQANRDLWDEIFASGQHEAVLDELRRRDRK